MFRRVLMTCSEGAVTVTVTAVVGRGLCVWSEPWGDWVEVEPGTATLTVRVGGGAGVVCGGVAGGGGGDAVGV